MPDAAPVREQKLMESLAGRGLWFSGRQAYPQKDRRLGLSGALEEGRAGSAHQDAGVGTCGGAVPGLTAPVGRNDPGPTTQTAVL